MNCEGSHFDKKRFAKGVKENTPQAPPGPRDALPESIVYLMQFSILGYFYDQMGLSYPEYRRIRNRLKKFGIDCPTESDFVATPSERRILSVLDENKYIKGAKDVAEIGDRTGIPSVKVHLSNLRSKGFEFPNLSRSPVLQKRKGGGKK